MIATSPVGPMAISAAHSACRRFTQPASVAVQFQARSNVWSSTPSDFAGAMRQRMRLGAAIAELSESGWFGASARWRKRVDHPATADCSLCRLITQHKAVAAQRADRLLEHQLGKCGPAAASIFAPITITRAGTDTAARCSCTGRRRSARGFTCEQPGSTQDDRVGQCISGRAPNRHVRIDLLQFNAGQVQCTTLSGLPVVTAGFGMNTANSRLDALAATR